MDALVKDFWGVATGTLTPGVNNWGIGTFKLSENEDGFVCRPCIKELGIPYGIFRWLVPRLKNTGTACVLWPGTVDPVGMV
jgi:hypothetical protein